MAGFFVFIFLLLLILLPIGLIRPSLFQRFFINTRKKVLGVFGGLLVLFFILIGVTAPPSSVQPEVSQDTKGVSTHISSSVTSVNPTVANVSKAPTPTATPTPTFSPSPTKRVTQTPSPTKKITPTPTKIVYPTATRIPVTQYIAPTNPPTAIPIKSTSGSYVCDCSRTCTEISTCAEAQYQLNNCGCSVRDGDHDGVACDSAPLHCQN